MNELFAVEPSSCENAAELKLLMKCFGPEAGRYMLAFPMGWRQLILEYFSAATYFELERVKTVLRRAKEEMQVVDDKSIPYDGGRDWGGNALFALDGAHLHGVVFSREKHHDHHCIFTMDTLDLSPTAEERIEATPQEITRVCKVLLASSSDVLLIDPYLNPCQDKYKKVLSKMMRVIESSALCRRVEMWARYKSVIDKPGNKSDLESALTCLRKESGLSSKSKLEMILVDDEFSERMHGRYLLTNRGGVRLDQGFQKLPGGRKMDVSPIGRDLIDKLQGVYIERAHDMKIAMTVSA